MGKIAISEDFYSVQGEGPSTGFPAYFVRLKDCNLTCGASWAAQRKIKEAGEGNTDPGGFKGDLHESGEATWTCDTLPVWTFGHVKEMGYLIETWTEQNIINKIIGGDIHVIWTGGEPTLPKHQAAIMEFDDVLFNHSRSLDLWYNPYYEIETNGTIPINGELLNKLHQINCSAKLSNSGMAEDRRINSVAIKTIMRHNNYNFKFVVSTEDDIKEFMTDYVDKFNIPLRNVVAMPGLDSQEDFHERTRFVLEMSKKYGFRGMTRLHVSAWNQTTGV